MRATFENYGLYTIDLNYLEYLYGYDKQVCFGSNYQTKPHLGAVVGLGKNKYFIPFTSPNPKHASWRYEDSSHMLMYEKRPKGSLGKNAVYKNIPNDEKNVNQIFGVILFNKMIPVVDGQYSLLDVTSLKDKKYQKLLWKEILFCSGREDKILEKATKVYTQQKKSGKVRKTYVNFFLLEKASKKYK